MRDVDTTVGAWRRVVKPGKTLDGDLWVTIEYRFDMNKKWELSLTAVAGPKRNGDALGGCGQCRDYLIEPFHSFEQGWDRAMVDHLFEVWERWHLNGMRAGTPRQEEFLKTQRWPGYPENHYDWAKRVLAEAGLQPDLDPAYRTNYRKGDPIPLPYSYGSAWLYEEVPADVLEFLLSLPWADGHPWGDCNYFNEEQR